METALDHAPVVILAALVGWCLGFASAWLTDWLQVQDDLPLAAHGFFVRDLIVQAGSALLWAGAVLFVDGEWWRWVAAGLIAVPLVQIAVTDFRHRYVYTIVAAIGAVIGLALGWLVHNYDWWWGLVGAAGGFFSFLVVYLIGRLIYRGEEPLARGDITIAAMVGAGAGTCTLNALVLGVLISGLFALGVLVARRERHAMLPYGPGLCLGGLVTLFRC
jgi:prepilin signal peptidase PulO-like enzyme (type II secretory pathway)